MNEFENNFVDFGQANDIISNATTFSISNQTINSMAIKFGLALLLVVAALALIQSFLFRSITLSK